MMASFNGSHNFRAKLPKSGCKSRWGKHCQLNKYHISCSSKKNRTNMFFKIRIWIISCYLFGNLTFSLYLFAVNKNHCTNDNYSNQRVSWCSLPHFTFFYKKTQASKRLRILQFSQCLGCLREIILRETSENNILMVSSVSLWFIIMIIRNCRSFPS